jgi:glycosyltransferase involved in cell wall biosynthesis
MIVKWIFRLLEIMNKDADLISSNKASKYLHEIGSADILVGMPSYNNVITADYVVSQIVKGLDTYFPDYNSVIFVSDGGSGDETLTSVKKTDIQSANIKLIPTIYIGASGKGTAIQAIFEAARYLQVKSVALVDSDLRSITPEWIKLLIAPTTTGTDFVAPLYNRSKYDGTITNFLCYPVVTSLFGKNVRQPIGGDFGLSIRLVEEILESSMWDYPYVSRFGIDIFETCTALAKGFKVMEATLGVKEHDPKDPSSQLAGMFRQVTGTMFKCIEKYESVWKKTSDVTETEKIGDEKYDGAPPAIDVSLRNTIRAFNSNYENYSPTFRSLLSKDIITKFEQLKKLESSDVDFPSEIWAKTVYAFITAFNREYKEPRAALFLIDALRILWIGRVAAFMKVTWDLERDQAEEKIREEARVFAKLKPQLTNTY